MGWNLIFSIMSIIGDVKLAYLAHTSWGLKIIEVEENARPSGLAPFLKAHECVNHPEQMEV